jgi:hypothetical protein
MNAVVKEKELGIGERYGELWRALIVQWDAHAKALDDLKARENDYFGAGDGSSWLDGGNGSEANSALQAKMKELFSHLIAEAERVFSPPFGTRLDIDSSKYSEKFIPDRKSYLKFSPEKLWATLERDYSGQKGADLRHQQIAKGLISLFGLRRKKNVETRGGAMILDVSVYMDSYNKAELNYHSSDELQKKLPMLAAFFAWAGDNETARTLESFARNLYMDRRRIVVSREKIKLSPNLEIVTYFTRYEFRFSLAMGEQLQVFLGTFAAGELNEDNR